MADIRLIALDLDGTLLSEKKEILPESIEALTKARKRGAEIALCTGRNYADALYFSRLLGFSPWTVTANGAYIRKAYTKKAVYTEMLDEKDLSKILDVCQEFHTTPCLHTPFCEYTGDEFARLTAMLKARGIEPFENPHNRYVRLSPGQWREVAGKQRGTATKCILYHDNLETVMRMEKRLLHPGGFEVASSVMFSGTMRNLEVNRRGVSKGAALKILTSLLGFQMKNVLALGDSGNDLSMLREAGIGVAMENAPEEVKQCADAVTGPNTGSGVADAINRYN